MSLRDFLRFIIVACFFATPFICLIVAESMFFPFITGKNFTFRILVEVMLGAWALLMFLDAKYRPKFSWILGAAGAFIVTISLADFLGVNPYKSFWSNYERMEGLVTHLHLFFYFIISGSVLLSEEIWNWFWRTSLGVSLIVAIYAFMQLSGKADIHQSATRLDATFGNSAYLAVYTLFSIFIATFLYFRSDKKTGLHWFYPAIILVNGVVLFYTQTRGSLLGLLGGAFLSALLIAIFGKDNLKARQYSRYAVVGIVVLIGLFITFKNSSFVQSSPTLQRMASISISDSTTSSRFMIWQMSWEGFKERPILGWGQDNFLYVFSKHYNPKMWSQEPWFDRSHDVFFDWLVAGGILGLLTYLSMFVALLYHLWFSRKHHFSVIEKSVFTGMIAGYFVHNIFVFDNLTSYIVFFGLLGYIHALSAEDRSSNEKSTQKKEHRRDEFETTDILVAGAIITVATAGMIYFVNIRNINANLALIQAMQSNQIIVQGEDGKQKIALEDLIRPDLFGSDEVREQLAQFAVQTLDPRVDQTIRQMFFDLTNKTFQDELLEDPNNLRTQSFLATFYARFGQYEKALEHFKKSIELSPRRQSNYIDLAMMYVSTGRPADAEPYAKTAYDLEPINVDAGIAYVTTLVYGKKVDQATPILATLGNSAFDSRIINAYGNTGDYNKVIELINEKSAKGFAVGRDYFSLAGALDAIGKKDAAIEALQKAATVDASLKEQSEQLINQLKGGQSIIR